MSRFLTRSRSALLGVALTASVLGLPAGATSVDPTVTITDSTRDRERGVRFRPVVASQVTALRYYRVAGDRARHVARLWSPDGREVARLTFARSTQTGWSKVALPQGVAVSAAPYTVSFTSRAGVAYAVDRQPGKGSRRFRILGGAIGDFGEHPDKAIRSAYLVRPVISALPPATSFPGAANTGVPDGVALSPYNGPDVVTTPGTVINGRQVDTPLTIETTGVVITNSHVSGNIAVAEGGSVSITDSTVDGGRFNGSAVGQYGVTMRRVEVVGARQSVSCNESCDVQDSWLHGQYMEPGSDWHGDGFISNGGHDMVVRHNTLACDSMATGNGGCSAAVALFADFNPLSRITIDGNLFTAGPAAYCLYGGFDPAKPYGDESTNIVITNNVFQLGANRKCASFGPVTAIADSGEGNVFDGNVWEDGRRVRAP